jgi:hypothetical protein
MIILGYTKRLTVSRSTEEDAEDEINRNANFGGITAINNFLIGAR